MIGSAETRQAIDRRRRMMSAEELAESDLLLGEFGVVLSPVSEVPAPNADPGDPLIRRLISARLWKHVLLIVALTALLSGAGHSAITADANSRIGLSSGTAERGAPPSVTGIAGILLCLSGQLCFVIGWRRSQSPRDFHGRYHAWRWLSVILITAGALTITAASSEAARLLQLILESFVGSISAARPVVLLLPVTCCLTPVAARILPDMRSNPAALILLTAGCLTTAALVAAESGLTRITPGVAVRVVLILANAGLVFSACLLHCRYVIHVSHHPGGDVAPGAQRPALAVARDGETAVLADGTGAVASGADSRTDQSENSLRSVPGTAPAAPQSDLPESQSDLPAPQSVSPADELPQTARNAASRQKNQRRMKKAG